jgi:hypothetical protein
VLGVGFVVIIAPDREQMRLDLLQFGRREFAEGASRATCARSGLVPIRSACGFDPAVARDDLAILPDQRRVGKNRTAGCSPRSAGPASWNGCGNCLELKKTGAFVVPGLAKFIVIKKPATKAREGINPFTKEPTTFKAKPARKIARARPVKAVKDAVA